MPADRTDHTQKTGELLQSYARQRREQAGPPFVLHPATRNLLQDEVTRTYRTPSRDARRQRGVTPSIWLRLILGGAAVAALLLGAGLWLRYDHEQEVAASRALTNSLMIFAQNPPSAPALAPPTAGPTPDRIRGFELAAGGGNGTVLTKNSSTTAAGAAAAGGTAAAGPGAHSPSDGVPTSVPPTAGFGMAEQPALPPEPGAFSESLTRGLRLSEADGKDAVKDSAKVGLLVTSAANSAEQSVERREPEQVSGRTEQLAASTSPEASLRFQRVDGRYRQNLNSPPPVTVLRNFEVQRQGDTVRVVDGDGSVYAGGIVQNGSAGAALATAPSASFAAANSQAPAQNIMTASVRDNAALAPFTFQAVGTNRTLNQMVVFTGEYSPANATSFSNQLANSAANSFANNSAPVVQTSAQVSQARSLGTGASRAKTLAQPLQQVPSNRLLMPGRIEGRAMVGPRDTVTIEAQQVGP